MLTESELTMKAAPYLLIAGLSLLPIVGHGEETAQARMYCLSLRFQRSMDQNGLYTLDLTTLTSGVNGELAFGDFFGNGYSHSSFPILTDEVFGDGYNGGMDLDIPPGNDVNGNSYPDFFQFSWIWQRHSGRVMVTERWVPIRHVCSHLQAQPLRVLCLCSHLRTNRIHRAVDLHARVEHGLREC